MRTGRRHYDVSEELFSQNLSCPDCGISYGEISPRSFSFNNAYGACPECSGIGSLISVDPDLCINDPKLSINEGAITAGGWNFNDPKSWGRGFIVALSEKYKFSLDTPYCKLSKKVRDIIMYGNGGEKMKIDTSNSVYKRTGDYYSAWEGLVPSIMRRYNEAFGEEAKAHYEQYMSVDECPVCKGARLRKESLSIYINKVNIASLTSRSVKDELKFISKLTFNKRNSTIAAPILREIKARLQFLSDVGLEYMTLSRPAMTLSGGEAQRIRLATQIGSGLQGVLYILDEPSIGLHQRDNEKLLHTLDQVKRSR